MSEYDVKQKPEEENKPPEKVHSGMGCIVVLAIMAILGAIARFVLHLY